MLKKYIFLGILLIPIICFAHPTTYAGKLILKNKTIYKYKLAIEINDKTGEVTGYSITDEGGANETKTLLRGKFVNKNLTFEEYEITSTKTQAKDVSFCYVNASLILYTFGKDKYLKGPFVGILYPKKQQCGTGIIDVLKMEEKKTEKPKDLVVTKPTVAPQEKIDIKQFTVLNNNNTYNWTSDSAKIELWDQGNQDGDIISLFVDGVLLKSNIKLTNNKMVFTIPIAKKSEHIISIRAENEGKYPPNTASIIIYDKEKKYMLYSESKEFEMKSIKITR